MTELAPDYWLANSPSQPKKEIADYVESQGILVPRRFDDIEEAIASVQAGGKIILRSEHRDEYDGPSGLFDSYILSAKTIERGSDVRRRRGPHLDLDSIIFSYAKKRRRLSTGVKIDDWELAQMSLARALTDSPDLTLQRLKAITSRDYNVMRYAELLGQEAPDVFTSRLEYSFWEKIDGLNIILVADDVVPGRYHAFGYKNFRGGYHGSIVDEGGVIIKGQPDEVLHRREEPWIHDSDTYARAITIYEQVRSLPKFASNHCPIMEMVADNDGRLWFLQYHRSRDKGSRPDKLQSADFPVEKGWILADGARGALDDPATLKMALGYPEFDGRYEQPTNFQLPIEEDASAEYGATRALSEILSRRRIGYIGSVGFVVQYVGMAEVHVSRSTWFKARCAVAMGKGIHHSLPIPGGLERVVRESVHKQGKMARIVIDLASDGETGYFRLNPDSEQPVFTDS